MYFIISVFNYNSLDDDNKKINPAMFVVLEDFSQ